MNKLSRFVLLLSGMMIALGAAAEPKVGYVEVSKVLATAPQATEIAKKLQKEFSPRTAELTRLQKQIADSTTREHEQSALRLEFERKQRELNEDINLRKNEELGGLQSRINKAVTAVAEAEGYDLVLYSGLAYGSRRIDLTDKVLKALDKVAP